jgi:NitT/TauT family transport system ATP-binding protein
MTTVLVTHSIRQAVYMASRIMVMDSSPGRLRRELLIDLGSRDSDTRTSQVFNEQVRLVQHEIRNEAHA